MSISLGYLIESKDTTHLFARNVFQFLFSLAVLVFFFLYVPVKPSITRPIRDNKCDKLKGRGSSRHMIYMQFNRPCWYPKAVSRFINPARQSSRYGSTEKMKQYEHEELRENREEHVAKFQEMQWTISLFIYANVYDNEYRWY